MELTDEAKAEIKAAIDILKSDGIHFTKAMEKHLKTKEEPPAPDPSKTSPPDPTGGPPPKADPVTDPAADPPKKRGLWWGDRE